MMLVFSISLTVAYLDLIASTCSLMLNVCVYVSR